MGDNIKRNRMPYHAVIDAYQDGESTCWVRITDDQAKCVAIFMFDQESGCWQRRAAFKGRPSNIPNEVAIVEVTTKEDDKDGIPTIQVILNSGKLEYGMHVERLGDGGKYICTVIQSERFCDDIIWQVRTESSSEDCDGRQDYIWDSISYGGLGEDGSLTSPEYVMV